MRHACLLGRDVLTDAERAVTTSSLFMPRFAIDYAALRALVEESARTAEEAPVAGTSAASV